jgi:uncharacterized protein (TIGR01319 family)
MSEDGVTAIVDFGSTFTKVRIVDASGDLIAAGQDRTTIETDVMEGLEAALVDAGAHAVRVPEDVLACSSAGGGLRMVVVGLVDDLTTEAAHQTALGAGARVAEVVSGGLRDEAQARALLATDPDIVLLTGGTDGGDAASLIRGAEVLAAIGTEVPIVLAGNAEAQDPAAAILAGSHVVRAPNVLPAIGQIEPDGAREGIRELFIAHVIGGKLRTATGRLEEMVRMATPDAGLRGVEVLGRGLVAAGGAGVVAVDVGGATTDVHSWAPNLAGGATKQELIPQTPAARTVEADLGMRWNAVGIVLAGEEEGLLDRVAVARLLPAAERRAQDPSLVARDAEEVEIDRALARTAITIALRRHAGERRMTLTPQGAVVERSGRDLTEVGVLLGVGGVLRALEPTDLEACLEAARKGRADRLLPRAPRTCIDRAGVLIAAGVLATRDEDAARRLLDTALNTHDPIPKEEPDAVGQP